MMERAVPASDGISRANFGNCCVSSNSVDVHDGQSCVTPYTPVSVAVGMEVELYSSPNTAVVVNRPFLFKIEFVRVSTAERRLLSAS